MIKSMTGFGRRQGVWNDGTVAVEIRSVNHRFLEASIRMPKSIGRIEETFRKVIQEQCARGRVECTVFVQGNRGSTRSFQFDAGLAKQYYHTLRTLQRSLKLRGSIDIGFMAGFRDLLSVSDQPVEDPKLAKLVEKLGLLAIHDLVKMRRKEGALLAQDFTKHLETLGGLKRQVAERAPTLVQESFLRMKGRVEKLLEGPVPDLPRLYQELALYADRSDITEELVRLDAHMVQFGQTIQSTQPVGKTLDFFLQEMGREINTIGSKSNDTAVATTVIQMRAELERLREQVQNVE